MVLLKNLIPLKILVQTQSFAKEAHKTTKVICLFKRLYEALRENSAFPANQSFMH